MKEQVGVVASCSKTYRSTGEIEPSTFWLGVEYVETPIIFSFYHIVLVLGFNYAYKENRIQCKLIEKK